MNCGLRCLLLTHHEETFFRLHSEFEAMTFSDFKGCTLGLVVGSRYLPHLTESKIKAADGYLIPRPHSLDGLDSPGAGGRHSGNGDGEAAVGQCHTPTRSGLANKAPP